MKRLAGLFGLVLEIVGGGGGVSLLLKSYTLPRRGEAYVFPKILRKEGSIDALEKRKIKREC